MPFVHTANLRTFYRLEGDGGQPVVMFAHSLGVDHGQWDPQSRQGITPWNSWPAMR